METITLIGAIFGGLGLFLLAIGMMTDGLKLATGSNLRKLLSKWCSTPIKGIFSGFLMTAIVQSSSAVTVASLGFVNAGLINMRHALGIVYGANIGTTMTGWLVALIGFNLDIQAFALPLIGVGMTIKLVKQQGQVASMGLVLVGFGLFFTGIDVLKNAFDGMVHAFDISHFTADGISGILLFVLLGVVMTVMTQSSSASIALTITAASSGMVEMYTAGAMVIGANIGTTSTALLASIGATSPAKRVAAAQVLFNLITASAALLMLPLLFFIIRWMSQTLDISAAPSVALAMFHTIFNLFGVLIVYPYNDRLASFLEKRFSTWQEKESNPKYIDKNVAQTPVLAVNALILELQAISTKVLSIYGKAINPTTYKLAEFETEIRVIKSLITQVSNFIVNVQSSELAEDTSDSLTTLMRIEQYFLSCTLWIHQVADQLIKKEKLSLPSLEQETVEYFQKVLAFMNASRLNVLDSPQALKEQYSSLKEQHEKLKASLIVSGTHSHISVLEMSETIDCLAKVRQLTQQWYKAITRLQQLEVGLQSHNGQI